MVFGLLSFQAGAWLVAGLSAFALGPLLALGFTKRQLSIHKEHLRLEKERWLLHLEANQDGVFDANLRTGDAFLSPQWLNQIGYSEAEWRPDTQAWLDQIHPDDRARVERTFTEYLGRDLPTYDIEYRLRHRDGHWCWIHARAHAIWDENGHPIRLIGSHANVTSRKQAEADLMASEARFRIFLDNNPVATYIKSEDGRLLYANKTMRQKFGFELADILGKPEAEIWPGEVAARLREDDLAVLASETTREFLETVVLPDGSTRELLTTKFVFRDATGCRVLGGTALDIGERRKAEEALRDSEERYRELFERNPLPAWIYNPEGLKIEDVNEAAIAHYGWSRAEFLGLTLKDIRIPDPPEALEEDLPRLLARRGNTGPWRHRRKDGSIIWVEVAGQDLCRASSPLHLTLVYDITERVEAAKNVKLAYERLETLVEQRTTELRESEAKWRALVEATPQIVFASGPMGESDYMSPRAVEYTGLPLSDLVAGKWLKVVHPADQFRAAAVWRAALQSGTSYDVEFRIRSQSGVYRWFKSVARPVRDVEGKITRWIGISTDIDDQKRSEEALEAAVARRTLELAEARDRAEAATRAKSQFLAAMSHEIRTPMNGVIGMANVMLDTDLTSEQRCYMDTIRSSGQALLIVINDILDLSKIEAGRLDLERTEFDLSTLIEEAVELIGPQAAAKNLALQCDVDDSIPLDLLGDPARLRQIVLNLLNNAVKFTSTGSITLFVTREANQSHMTVLRFAIRDTGIGLTQKQQDGLFQPFQQADLSTSRRFGGTGLGLVISKRLVEMMGGSIGVHSQVGEGSTFWFNVCLETASVFADWERFAGKRVVMVSHHPKAASVICSYLQTVGLCITTYARLPRPDRTAFDLLLVDSAAVPQASDAVQLANFDRGPILILGTQADVRSIPMPEKTEIVFVPKPVRRLPLLRAIESALEGKMSVEEPASPSSLPPGHRGRVLLADDNKVNQLVARILLEKLGYCVDVVDNGMEACNAVQRQLYDIVLMDCQMPVMNGFQATQRIRSVEIGGRHTPIIAVTAGVLKEERDRCYACGMDDFLSKPISQEDLANTLGKWIPIQEKRAS